jgi:hypothetical protein
MARNLHVYPKAILQAPSTWRYLVKVYEPATRINSRFEHTEPAGVTAELTLPLLKLSYDLTVPDVVTDQDVDDAHWSDTAQGGPNNGKTLWDAWRDIAETNLTALGTGYTLADWYAEWSNQDTSRIRDQGRRILVNGRGWVIDVGSIHQHEGDGSNTDG